MLKNVSKRMFVFVVSIAIICVTLIVGAAMLVLSVKVSGEMSFMAVLDEWITARDTPIECFDGKYGYVQLSSPKKRMCLLAMVEITPQKRGTTYTGNSVEWGSISHFAALFQRP